MNPMLTPRPPDRGDEVQFGEFIGNITRINDDGTCDIAWWMPTGGPFGSAMSHNVPLDVFHVRQDGSVVRSVSPDFVDIIGIGVEVPGS